MCFACMDIVDCNYLLFAEVTVCHYKNGGCMQYCTDLQGGTGVQCDCTDGYELQPDGHSCSQTGDLQEYPKNNA